MVTLHAEKLITLSSISPNISSHARAQRSWLMHRFCSITVHEPSWVGLRIDNPKWRVLHIKWRARDKWWFTCSQSPSRQDVVSTVCITVPSMPLQRAPAGSLIWRLKNQNSYNQSSSKSKLEVWTSTLTFSASVSAKIARSPSSTPTAASWIDRDS